MLEESDQEANIAEEDDTSSDDEEEKLNTAREVRKLVQQFSRSLIKITRDEKDSKGNILLEVSVNEKRDLDKFLKRMRGLMQLRGDEINELSFGPSLSALIAAASVVVQSTSLDIESLELDIPTNIRLDMKGMLLTFFKAVQMDGYQTSRKLKAFIVGNTGITFFSKIMINVSETITTGKNHKQFKIN